MKSFLSFILFALSAVAIAEPLKVAFVYVTPIGDAGWSYQHNLGRLAVEAQFGDKVKTRYLEGIGEGPDAERVIRKLASSGYKLIFATSFGYMNPTLKVAKAFPKVIFEHATGYKTAPNMGNYSPRFYEGRYLAGMAAGAKTRTNIIGYVAGFPIPEVVRGVNAFTLGAQSINPDARVKVIWMNSWFDPVRESEAATSLIAQKADVLTHHTDSVAIVKAANDKGKHAIAYHSDMQKHGGKAQIGAIIHSWESFYVQVVDDLLSGTWKSSSRWYGIKQGMVDFKITSDLPERVVNRIRLTRSAIILGNFRPFSGEIYDQNGKKRSSKGEYMSDPELKKMDYFVRGVEGKIGS